MFLGLYYYNILIVNGFVILKIINVKVYIGVFVKYVWLIYLYGDNN